MRSTKTLLIAVLAVPLLPCVVLAQNNAGNQNPFHWTGTLTAGQTLGLKNVNGDIKVEATAGNQVEVTATKRGSHADAIRMQVVPSSDGVTICAIFPNGKDGDASSCEAGTQWN